MIEATEFGGQNWLITPAARAVGEAAPASIGHQKWLLVLSGVAIVNMKGSTATDWLRDTVHISPNMNGPLNYAIDHFSIPRPGAEEYGFGFQVEQWSPFATVSSIFDENQSVNAGFAVDKWGLAPLDTGFDLSDGTKIGNIFRGIMVDVGVRDSDAWLYRVGYNITLLGRIVFTSINL
jgi:hypothetical protein